MSINSKSKKGFFWNTLQTATSTLLQFARIAILARFLTKEEFGLMSIVLVYLGFISLFEDLGLGKSIIQNKTEDKEVNSLIHIVNVSIGVVVFLITILFGSTIAQFFNQPEISNMLWISSFTFIFNSLVQVRRQLLIRYLNFKVVSISVVVSEVVSTFVAILLAYNNFGVYTLVISHLTGVGLNSVLIYYLSKSEIVISKSTNISSLTLLRKHITFGLYQVGERITNYFSINLDKSYIGKYLGVGVLGQYNMSYQMVLFPIWKILPIISSITFPSLSRLQDDDRGFKNYFISTYHGFLVVLTPVLSLMFLFPQEIILVIFGSEWMEMSWMIKMMCLMGFVKALSSPFGAALLAKGYANVAFYWNLFLGLATLGFISVASVNKYNIQDFITNYNIFVVVCTPIWFFIVLKKTKLNDLLLYKEVFITLLFFAIGLLCTLFLLKHNFNFFVSLIFYFFYAILLVYFRGRNSLKQFKLYEY